VRVARVRNLKNVQRNLVYTEGTTSETEMDDTIKMM
jgi:hypothetical protein